MQKLIPPDPQWYKKMWSLSIHDTSCVEHTQEEVDFLVTLLDLKGSERILDLACGFGRHAHELARRGYEVTGVDCTAAFIQEAEKIAQKENLPAKFICSDLRDLSFHEEFDVVINMADGAIGYLENDDENLKIFDLIASSLPKGGKHFMHIRNAEHAELFFPQRHWELGNNAVSFAQFEWDEQNRRMLCCDWHCPFASALQKPVLDHARSSIRLYSLLELETILLDRRLLIKKSFGSFDKTVSASSRQLQLLVYSEKK
ncbi:MAG: class I SAM-dependent methyltransferase [Chitinivibrionales bacterium]|nr:class I SAM-dependent methyltransferase [Chitinivibrionales bacterium]